MEDNLLAEFVNESREHLATIETDLLMIEEGGANMDEELVNKVFRAAHSIKGGAGFFGLAKAKELAHKAETVLDMLRTRKLIPNAEVTNVLLAAFDKLRDMINNTANCGQYEIDDLVISLTDLAASYLQPEEKIVLMQNIVLKPQGGGPEVTLPQVDFDRAKRSNQYIYSLRYDLIHDVERQGRNILEMFRDLSETGEVLDCELDFSSVGSLEESISSELPLRLIFATVIDPSIIEQLVHIPEEQVALLFDPQSLLAAKQPRQESEIITPAEPAPPPPEPEMPMAVIEEPAATRPAPAAQSQRSEAPPPQQAGAGHSSDDTLRVNVGLLESLMNLAGELVLSRNQLHAAIGQSNVEALSAADQRLNQVTSELQDAIMRTRLQPIGNVFGKFPRVVRDMANSLGKDIVVDIRGKDVALDRSLIEGLSDPLTHMVRNAVDHGIESPQERTRAGKKSSGTIRIEAKHEAGQVVIEIADDGKGIDPHRVAEAALKKGLVSDARLRAMSESDLATLIFLPGLSTATKVSDLSGRGVGMDVVKTNLDRLGGKVEIKSEVGKGTLFRIKLPLTLAIIPSLIVSIEGERFAIPQINVEELLRVRQEDIRKKIEVVGDAEVLFLRDRIIPLIRLDRFLQVLRTYVDSATGAKEIDRRVNLADRRSPHYPVHGQAAEAAAEPPRQLSPRADGERRTGASGALEIAVVTTGTLQYGIVVGAFHNTEEIVVKPLGRHLKGLREYAGATILGDGTVALILDVGGLAAKTELTSVSGSTRAVELEQQAEREKRDEVRSLLLFHNSPEEVCAVPLDTVLRLEKIKPEQIETHGGRRTMQYRGASLSLVSLSDAAAVQSIDSAENLAVIVSEVNGREVGLLGAMPVDVVETREAVDTVTHRQRCIAGSMIIYSKTTLLVDVIELVEAVYPDWIVPTAPEFVATTVAPELTGVLLAEDSDFFRAQIKRYLEEDGLIVFDAPDGQAAWELLLQNVGAIRAVVTDIEMPRMNGLELTRQIRSDSRTSSLPVIALSSLAADEDVAKGKTAGVDDYQVKLDRDQLISSLRARLHAAPAEQSRENLASV